MYITYTGFLEGLWALVQELWFGFIRMTKEDAGKLLSGKKVKRSKNKILSDLFAAFPGVSIYVTPVFSGWRNC